MRSLSRNDLFVSNDIQMYDQASFYEAFEKDLSSARSMVIIESPFITTKRINSLLPVLTRLTNRGVRVTINTRNPIDHDLEYRAQALESVEILQSMSVEVFYTVKHHRKIAVIDNRISWNGSLNILSQNDSCVFT